MTTPRVGLYSEQDSLLAVGTCVPGEADTTKPGPQGGFLQRLFPSGGFASTCFSFAAASMGAGTLGLPQAFQAAGIGIGIVQLALVCAATVYSMRLLAIAFERTGCHTFEALSRELFGRGGWFAEKLTAFLIVMFCWGATVAYVVTVGDIISKVVDGIDGVPAAFLGTNGRRWLTVVYWALTMMPLSLLLEINSLRYATLLSTSSSLYLIVTIVVHAASQTPAQQKVREDDISWANLSIDMVVAIPTFVFAFCCQTNLFEIYAEMVPRTVRRVTTTSATSIVLCTVLYVAAGVAGYANFGSATRGDILNNYYAFESPYVTIAFFAICLTLTVSYPLCIYPTRDAVVQLLGYSTAYETPAKVRLPVCFILSALSLTLGLFVPSIQILFGVLGGVCGSAVAFVLPALYYIRSAPFTPADVGLGNFIAVIALLVVGLTTGLLGTALSIWQLATGQSN